MFSSSDVHTVTEFSRKPAAHIKRLADSKRPELLTVNGKSTLVVQDAAARERMADSANHAESLQNIRRALSEPGRPLAEFAAEFTAKHGVARRRDAGLK